MGPLLDCRDHRAVADRSASTAAIAWCRAQASRPIRWLRGVRAMTAWTLASCAARRRIISRLAPGFSVSALRSVRAAHRSMCVAVRACRRLRSLLVRCSLIAASWLPRVLRGNAFVTHKLIALRGRCVSTTSYWPPRLSSCQLFWCWFIPACAGCGTAGAFARPRRAVHSRVRGGISINSAVRFGLLGSSPRRAGWSDIDALVQSLYAGSSPRAWGGGGAVQRRLLRAGFIPARAGLPRQQRHWGPRCRVPSPRRRGHARHSAGVQVPSPRARG